MWGASNSTAPRKIDIKSHGKLYKWFAFPDRQCDSQSCLCLPPLLIFWDYRPKSIKCQFLGTNEYKIKKHKSPIVIPTSKFYKMKVPFYFQFFDSSMPKIENCFKYFLDLNSIKQPLCTCQITGKKFFFTPHWGTTYEAPVRDNK